MKERSILNIDYYDNSVRIKNANNFSLADTLDCGQAFRWHEDNGRWIGVAHGRKIALKKDGNDVIIEGTGKEDFDNIWRNYFDLDRDYSHIIKVVSSDPKLCKICEQTSGIRLLRQDPWEALCSFIISQNNNIPRIKGIIERMCENFGEDIGGAYSFPTADKIANLTVEELAPLRSGFRAKYIIDAAKKVADGSLPINDLCNMDKESATQLLMTVNGVGPKVASCALLFGCGHIECFPIDVWIKRAMAVLFSDELPKEAIPYAGIVQQYIFHYSRITGLDADKIADLL